MKIRAKLYIIYFNAKYVKCKEGFPNFYEKIFKRIVIFFVTFDGRDMEFHAHFRRRANMLIEALHVLHFGAPQKTDREREKQCD